MWSFFARDPTKDFGYEIGETISGIEDKSIWELHRGKKKGTEQEFSIFIFEIKGGNDILLETAKASVKRLKTLRHPNILQYVDSLETEKVIYLVTEYVEPLKKHLELCDNEDQKKLEISWGLYQVAIGLGFLINDCNLSHNNIHMASVFVDRAGEWKIGGVDYTCSSAESVPLKTIPALDKYSPPEVSDSSRRVTGPKCARDSWGLGCLIWEVFNGVLPKTSMLQSVNKIPKSLAPFYCELVGANCASRPSPSDFITKCRTGGGFLKNNFIDTLLFLEEIQIKDTVEKNRFFSNLTSKLDSFPVNICKYKILPQLINAFEFGNAGSSVLAPLFKIGKFLDAEEYQKKIVPCVVKLFSSKDRATRARLLQQIDQFIDHLQPDLVNSEVFPHVVQGFLDTNPTIREQTVKCMVHMAPKLNYHNLNEEVMKHFARLQSRDDQGGIRTNTTVCLGKIACFLHPQTRQKVLIVAFIRAMRDPFTPARTASILALSATQGYFTLKDCATKVLPSLCALTLDPEKAVRDQAFKAIKGFLGKLEKVSEDPSLIEQMEADVNAASSTVPSSLAASWAGWAVTSLTSKFYRPSKPSVSLSSNPTKAETGLSQPVSPTSETSRKEDTNADSASDYEEKWEDQDWGSMEDSEHKSRSEAATSPDPSSQDGWEDGDWESFENIDTPQDSISPSKQESTDMPRSDLKPSSTYNWGTSENSSFFSELSSSSTTKKLGSSFSQQQQKSSSSIAKPSTALPKDTSSNWDTGDSWAKWDESGGAKDEELKRKRDEKRLQRQKEIQEKRAARQGAGPMKLGVRKDAL